MTAKERAQVVEMLRCSADTEEPLRALEVDLDMRRELTMIAVRAWDAAYRNVEPGEYRLSCLEAALAVENGANP